MPDAFHHTAYLVRDIETTAQKLADSLNVGPWNIWTIAPKECRVHGVETEFSFRVALMTVGGGTVELVTPLAGHSVFAEHLAKHGEGFHHACFVYPSLAAVGEARAELRRQGREIIQEGITPGFFDFAYAYFPELGSLIEVLHLDAAQLPEPDVVIQPREIRI